jgi:hypothetical protein
MSNKYLVTNTTQLNVTTTAVGMYEYLRHFAVREDWAQKIRDEFGDDVNKLLEINIDSLHASDSAKIYEAKMRLKKAIEEGETVDDVITTLSNQKKEMLKRLEERLKGWKKT